MRLNRIGVEVGEIGWHWETIKLVVEALQGRNLGELEKREEMVGWLLLLWLLLLLCWWL